MKHYRIHYNKSYSFRIIGLFIALSFSSCCRDIDKKIEDCYNANDTVISLSDLYPEEWDTLYYFSNAYNLEMMEKRVEPIIGKLYEDVGDRILILNKENEVVYYKEYFPNYGQKRKGAVFLFKDDPDMIAIPREKTKFLIRKRDEDSFWIFYIGEN
ncbi:MAG: hypothetical protein K5874_05305 [Bacteroidaceae bacterium]|nr:hypothetical protein [Bacteroidaceae bacterium]